MSLNNCLIELVNAAKQAVLLINHANRGAFDNGVVHEGRDEGDVLSVRIVSDLEDAIRLAEQEVNKKYCSSIDHLADAMQQNFNFEEYRNLEIKKHDEWCASRKIEIGEEKYNDETLFFGGWCETCNRRFVTVNIQKSDYNVCLYCRTHWLWGYGDGYTSLTDEKQAKNLLILRNTTKIK